MSDSSNLINARKLEHIEAILKDAQIERNQAGFDSIRLLHRALPELNYDEIDTSTRFLGKTLNFPFLISSMTGGAAENLADINRNLAIAAEKSQVALAVGSQRVMFKDPAAKNSFEIRQYAPTIPIIANIGAVQLNESFGIEQVQESIDILQADAIYLHLNPLQEIIQPEGDHNFSHLVEKIADLKSQLNVPIFLKEVGCGMSALDIEQGLKAGIEWFDLAGRGGTSWSRIEAHRSDNDMGIAFQDWGLTTVESLLIANPYLDKANFIASGGIRSGIDVLKSVIMGAFLSGAAAPLLRPAMQSAEAVSLEIHRFHQEFKGAQFLLGMPNVAAMRNNFDLLLSPPGWPATTTK